MIEIYAQNLAVTTGAMINFSSKAIQTGRTATLNSDGTAVQLNRPGIYRVDFNAYGEPTAAGNVGVQLMANGTARTYAAAEAASSAGEPAAVSFGALVAVEPAAAGNTATIGVQYTGAAGTLTAANMTVCKIA